MKKTISLLLAALLLAAPSTLSAQSLGNLLGGLFGKSGSTTTTTTTTAPATTATTTSSTTPSTQNVVSGILGALSAGATSTSDDGKAASNNGIVGGLLNSVLNAFSTVSEETLIGSWNYKGSAFVFESENVLANLGSDTMAKQVEAKVDSYLAKIGVKEGSCGITFKEDDTCVFTVGKRSLNGTYVYDAANKELALQFGLIKTKSFVVYDSGNINIVFQSDGVLKILKAVCAASSKSTLSMLGTLLNNYDGLRIGMSFTK